MTREERTIQREEEEEKERKKEKRKKRIFLLLKLIVVFILLVFLLLFYSRFIATSGLVVREYKITNEKLPAEFHGFKLIHFTDLHYGSTIDQKDFEQLVTKINQLKPDVVVFTGDLIDKNYSFTDEDFEIIANLLNQIQATVGKYAVSGNHDYSSPIYQDLLKSGNFKYIDNTYDLIYYHGYQPILITGISDSIRSNIKIDEAFSYFQQENSNQNIYTIALMHEPDDIDQILTTYSVDLALAGHSHNGQIRLPGIGSLVKIKGAKKYSEEEYQINSTSLYVSGGLGTSNHKYRLFNRPSINFYRLTTH